MTPSQSEEYNTGMDDRELVPRTETHYSLSVAGVDGELMPLHESSTDGCFQAWLKETPNWHMSCLSRESNRGTDREFVWLSVQSKRFPRGRNHVVEAVL